MSTRQRGAHPQHECRRRGRGDRRRRDRVHERQCETGPRPPGSGRHRGQDGHPAGGGAEASRAASGSGEAAGGEGADEEDEDGSWEVDVAVDDRSVEVVVDASGVVVRTDNDDLDEDDRAGLEAATISLSEAIELAIAEVGGYLDDVGLEEEDGEHYWEVALDGTDQGDDVEVKVSVTGEIVDIDD